MTGRLRQRQCETKSAACSHPCPAGAVAVLTRANIGPDTARYLMGQFQNATGGNATVVVRRVV